VNELLLPELPIGRGQATVVAWLAQPGDELAAGQALLVVDNDQAEGALPAPTAGRLGEILAPAGAAVVVGDRLATIQPAEPARAPTRATPVARRAAAALGVDLALLVGSGPDGRITRRDVQAAAPGRPAQPVAAPHGLPIGWSVMELRAERLLAACARPSPHPALPALALTPLICLAAAVAAALTEQPRAAGWWAEGGIATSPHIRLAVHSAGRERPPHPAPALIVGAENLSLRGLARALARNPAPPPGAPAATITISESAAMLHASQPPGPIPHLMLGPIVAQPVVDAAGTGERITAGRVARLALAYDARVLTFAEADRFLASVVSRLERFLLR
jgi:pyruvate dehydrogenase E2 component (dihydrolipoamide acetyltransferase)